MLLSQIFTDPGFAVATLVAFLLALSVHEASHALAAYLLGDRTALREHRLTLNPLAHIDWMGFLMLVTVGFGWGKPVPFNPYNLRWQRVGPILVAAAGPVSNFLFGTLAVGIFALAARSLTPTNLLLIFLALLAVMNMLLGLFNLIPLPPLDGSKALLAALSAPKYARARHFLETRGSMLLLGLVFLNIIFGINVFGWLNIVAQGLVDVLFGWFV